MTHSLDVKRDGVALGLIASLSVAVFYAVFDVLAARGGFYTINLLGKALFRGVRDPAILQYPVLPDPGAMLMYTGLHLALSLAIGLIVTRLIVQAERMPSQASQVLFVIAAGCVVTILAVGFLTGPIRRLLPWWSIVVANLLAVVVAGGYLVTRHPGIARRLLASAIGAGARAKA